MASLCRFFRLSAGSCRVQTINRGKAAKL